MTIVVVLCGLHTLEFAVYIVAKKRYLEKLNKGGFNLRFNLQDPFSIADDKWSEELLQWLELDTYGYLIEPTLRKS